MLNLDLWKLLLDLKSIASDILRYIFEPAEWIRYIAIYFNLPSEYDKTINKSTGLPVRKNT